VSPDPIRVRADQTVVGTLETDAVSAGRLMVKTGATLTQRGTRPAPAPESLAIDVKELVVESGGAIEVTARGYAAGVTYPAHAASNNGGSGGRHLGGGGHRRPGCASVGR